MNAKTVAPWLITAAALSAALFSFTRPAPQPMVAPTPAQAAAAHPVLVAQAQPAPAGMDAEMMRQIVREVMRDELSESAGMEPVVDAVPTEAQLDQVDDGLLLVDDLIDIGEVTWEDTMDMRLAISEMSRSEGEVVLSAYFEALNSGDIVVNGAPL